MKRLAIALLAALAMPATALAAPHSYYPRRHEPCRAHYVRKIVKARERRHGRIVKTDRAECVYSAPKGTSTKRPAPGPTTPTTTPTTTTPTATTPTVATGVPTPVSAPTPTVVRAGIDPSYTQDPTDPLNVTWVYSAAAGGDPLPTGTLSLTVSEPDAAGPSGACVIDVDSATTGGVCTIELPQYGEWDVTVSYVGDSASVAPTTSTDTETIEPPAVTNTYQWGSDGPTGKPTASVEIAGSRATVTISDSDFEGASSLGITDNEGDQCTAAISGTTATCSMTVSSVPASFTLAYPGGTTTTGTQTVAPGGVQQVTYEWPSDTVTISDPTYPDCEAGITVPVDWTAPGPTGGCSTITTPLGSSIVFIIAPTRANATGYLDYIVDGSVDSGCEDEGGTIPSGGCNVTFTTPGLHTVSAEYVSQNGTYGNGDLQPIYVDVSS